MSRPESTWCRRVSEATPIRMSIPEGCSVGVNHAAVDVAASGGVGSGRRSYLVVQVGKDGPEFPLCCLPSGFARQCRLSLAFSAADRLVILSVRGDATLSVAGRMSGSGSLQPKIVRAKRKPPRVAQLDGPAAANQARDGGAGEVGGDPPAADSDRPQLSFQDLVVGDGHEVARGARVRVEYMVALADGTQVDESRGRPLAFRVGKGAVIKGWDMGVVGMRVGGTRTLVVPPALGYGASGSGPIPPNATLVCNVTVVAAQRRDEFGEFSWS